MRILIDADGCPVVDIAVRAANRHKIDCLILCDTAHVYEKPGAVTLTFSKGADSVDFALVNMLMPGDVVVTQDYGLAAMCLARGAVPLSQDGMAYTSGNIDALLLARHTARKIRNAGGRLKGPARRTKEQDAAFKEKLDAVIEKDIEEKEILKRGADMTVILKPWSAEFAPAVAEYANNGKIAENLRDGFPQPYTLADAETYVAGCIEKGDSDQLCRAITADGEVVGSVGVFLREGAEAELGYWLGEPFWGRGIMTAAVKAVCALTFERFAVDRIYAVPYAHNAASRRVLEKSGFRFEGLTESCGCSKGAVCRYTLSRPAGTKS